jgi:hypothetical protein
MSTHNLIYCWQPEPIANPCNGPIRGSLADVINTLDEERTLRQKVREYAVKGQLRSTQSSTWDRSPKILFEI